MNALSENAPPDRAGHGSGGQNHRDGKGCQLAITGGSGASHDVWQTITCTLPTELTSVDGWMLWRGKRVPYRVHAPRRKAKSTDPATWASYADACRAFDPNRDGGLAIALSEGLACVDIDDCANEAQREQALHLLETLGCGYIEVSPSGDGLHGWAFSRDKLPKCAGWLGGLKIEVYNRKRIITVTGNAIVDKPLQETDSILRLSLALQREARFTESPESTESTASTEDRSLVVDERFLPTGPGQRNGKLFEWCRHVKGRSPNATPAEQVAYARQWFEAALPNIGTKDETVTIDDFLRGWSVAVPEGFNIVAVIEKAASVPIPELVANATGGHALAYQICVVLQKQRPGQPIFLPTRILGECLGVSHTKAAGVLRILRRLGVLIVAQEHTEQRATRYYVAPGYLE